MDTNQDPSVHNGDVLEKKDGLILTTINTIAVDKSNPGPEQPGPVRTNQVPAATCLKRGVLPVATVTGPADPFGACGAETGSSGFELLSVTFGAPVNINQLTYGRFCRPEQTAPLHRRSCEEISVLLKAGAIWPEHKDSLFG